LPPRDDDDDEEPTPGEVVIPTLHPTEPT
jgi:hypothetical protein